LESDNPFKTGDSAESVKFQELLNKLLVLKEGKTPFTIILDDAISNQFMYNPFAPEEDPQMKIEMYDRTQEQNEDLGLNQMDC